MDTYEKLKLAHGAIVAIRKDMERLRKESENFPNLQDDEELGETLEQQRADAIAFGLTPPGPND